MLQRLYSDYAIKVFVRLPSVVIHFEWMGLAVNHGSCLVYIPKLHEDGLFYHKVIYQEIGTICPKKSERVLRGPSRIRTGDSGFAIRGLTTWRRGLINWGILTGLAIGVNLSVTNNLG